MAVNQLIRAFIFGVTFYDPSTIVAVVVVLVIVTSLAAFLPARRASRVDPMVALRSGVTAVQFRAVSRTTAGAAVWV